MNRETSVERLRQAVRVLEAVKPEVFDMSVWLSHGCECDTVACAAGWCAMDPWFEDQQLRLNTNGYAPVYPVYRGHTGYDALAEFFGISLDAAQEIFSSVYYDDAPSVSMITPAMVAERIKAQIEKQS